MRVNLGCGEQYAPGWVNVDHAGSPHRRDQEVDLTGELPWSPGTWTHIYAGHLLEHLRTDQCVDLLKRLRDCSTSDCTLMVVGPDVKLAEQLQADGYALEVPLDQLRYGGGRWVGDVHMWECTRRRLVDIVFDAGWEYVVPLTIDQVPAEWPVAFRGPRWQVAVRAQAS